MASESMLARIRGMLLRGCWFEALFGSSDSRGEALASRAIRANSPESLACNGSRRRRDSNERLRSNVSSAHNTAMLITSSASIFQGKERLLDTLQLVQKRFGPEKIL